MRSKPRFHNPKLVVSHPLPHISPRFSHSIELYSLNIALCLQKLSFPTLLSTFCSFFPFFPRKRPAFFLRARHAPPDPLGSAAQGVGPACASPGARSGDRRSPRARYLWKREATRLRRWTMALNHGVAMKNPCRLIWLTYFIYNIIIYISYIHMFYLDMWISVWSVFIYINSPAVEIDR